MRGWIIIAPGALAAALVGGTAARPAPTPFPPPGAVACASPEAGTVSVEAHHARLARLLETLTGTSGRSLEVDPALAYRRLHLFFPRRSVDELTGDLAWITGAKWMPAGTGQRLTVTREIRERERRLRHENPDAGPAVPDAGQRLRLAGEFVRASRDPGILARLQTEQPMLARELADPLVQLVAAGIGTLQPYQALLMTGERGLRLPHAAIAPGTRNRILEIVRKENPQVQHVNAVDIKLSLDGALFLVVDAAAPPEIGGNVVFTRGFRPVGGPRPARLPGAARSGDAPRRPASDPPPASEVEPGRFLARDPEGALPYRFVESLRNLSRLYSLNIAADIRFQRPRVTGGSNERREAYRSLLRPSLPLDDCMRALAEVFGREYEHRGGVHFLRNPRWYWEEKYAHTDAQLTRVRELTPDDRRKLGTLGRLLDLSLPTAEGLAALWPEVGALVDRRGEVMLYAALEPGQRERLTRTGRLRYAELWPAQQRLFWNMLGIEMPLVPENVRGTFSVELLAGRTGERLAYEVTGAAGL